MILILNKIISLVIRISRFKKQITGLFKRKIIKQIIDYSYLRYHGVETQFGFVTLYGFPIIKKSEGSRIIISNQCTLISDPLINPAGITTPVLLATLSSNSILFIGENTGLSGCTICCVSSISIGSNCNFGANSKIYDTDFHYIDPKKRLAQKSPLESPSIPVVIENNVWMGTNSVVLKGVTLAENTVVGIGAIVTKSFSKNSILGGVPAKVIKGKL